MKHFISLSVKEIVGTTGNEMMKNEINSQLLR